MIADRQNDATSDRHGLMFVVSSPSGAGKSTICRMLLETEEAIEMSISATTRAQRAGEIAGRHYDFVDRAAFDNMVADHAFLEWAEVFGNHYGTPRAPVEALLARGSDVLFDIDWQGAQQLHQKAGDTVVRLFILPPSLDALERRLRQRGTDPEPVIAARMDRARAEISHWDNYDYVVVNDDLDTCFAKVRTILAAERLRRQRQTGLIALTRTLMQH